MTDKESNTGKFYTNYRFEYPKENVVVATSSFQDVPTNKKPLINLTVNGILRPSEEKVHEIKMIFEGNVPQKDKLAKSYGTFVLSKGVYNARKIIRTVWEKETSTLTILIDLTKEKVRPIRPAQFSFSIQINDCDDLSYPTNNYCKVGQRFPCKGSLGTVQTVTRPSFLWVPDTKNKLKVRTGINLTGGFNVCTAWVNVCECNNNLAEVSNVVCNNCAPD